MIFLLVPLFHELLVNVGSLSLLFCLNQKKKKKFSKALLLERQLLYSEYTIILEFIICEALIQNVP